jgi:hypothetical protein
MMTSVTRTVLVLAVLGLWSPGMGGLRLAAAQGATFSVPAGCGSEAELNSEISRLTGGVRAPEPRSLVIGAVGGGQGGYELRLALGDGVRVLHDPECRVLFRSAIVIVAAAAGVQAPESPPPESPPPESPPPAAPGSPALPPAMPASTPASSASPPAAPPAPPPVATPPRTIPSRPRATPAPLRNEARPATPVPVQVSATPGPPPRAPGRVQGGVGVGVGVSGGVLPGLGATLELTGRMEALPWGLLGAVRYWPMRSESREGRGVEVTALGAQVLASYRIATALNLLAGVEIDRLEGTGAERVSGGNAASAWQLASDFGLTLITWDIGYLRLEVGALGRVSLLRPKFVVTGFGNLYRAPAVGGDAIIRGVWLFP